MDLTEDKILNSLKKLNETVKSSEITKILKTKVLKYFRLTCAKINFFVFTIVGVFISTC